MLSLVKPTCVAGEACSYLMKYENAVNMRNHNAFRLSNLFRRKKELVLTLLPTLEIHLN